MISYMDRSLKEQGQEPEKEWACKIKCSVQHGALLHLLITKLVWSGDKQLRGTTAGTQGLSEETPRLNHSSTSLALTTSS